LNKTSLNGGLFSYLEYDNLRSSYFLLASVQA